MVGWLFGGMFFVIGLIFLILGIVSSGQAKKAKSWPATLGTVISSNVNSHTSRSNGVTNTTYEPVISYQYSFMGQTYTSSRIRFGPNRMKQNEAYDLINKYPAGSQTNVFYNPDKVSESTLEPTAQGSTVFTVLGAIMMVFGVLAAVYFAV